VSGWLFQLRAAVQDDLLAETDGPEGAFGAGPDELLFISSGGLHRIKLVDIQRVVRTSGSIVISGKQGALLCVSLNISNDQLQPFFQTVKALAKEARTHAVSVAHSEVDAPLTRKPIATGVLRTISDVPGSSLTSPKTQTATVSLESISVSSVLPTASAQISSLLPTEATDSATFWPAPNMGEPTEKVSNQDFEVGPGISAFITRDLPTSSAFDHLHADTKQEAVIDLTGTFQKKSAKPSKGQQKQSLLQGTIWMLLAYGVRLIGQGIAFVFLIRALGSEQFGAFMAAFALATLIAPIAEMGGYSLAVRDATANQSMPVTVGRSMMMILLCFPICLLIMALIKPLLLAKVAWSVVLCVVFAICLGGSLNRVALGIHVGQRMLDRNAILEAMNGLLQLVWVGVLYMIGPTVEIWTMLYLGHYLLLATVSLVWVSRTWGKPHLSLSSLRGGLREQLRTGSHFALGDVSRYGTMESDKMLLAHFSTLNATGTYSAAQRIIIVAFFPLQAFLGAAYSRFFEAGTVGISSTRALVSRFLPLVAAYGMAMWVIVYFSANILASLLGREYEDTATALRLVSPLMLIQGCQYLMVDSLSGGGFPNIRSAMQLVALVGGILINLILVPLLGWRGAALTNLIIQSLLTCALFAFIFTSTQKSNIYWRTR
jgi:O-antigen/teichoic acid export membrane protein